MEPKNATDRWPLVGLVALSLAEALSHFGQSYVDSRDYIEVELYFLGKLPQLTGLPGGETNDRLVRPVVPFLASLLYGILTPRLAFGTVNLVFWCAAAVLMFYFTKFLTNDIRSAAISAIFLTSAIPLLILGAAVYTDMAGYFFILLGSFIILKWDLPHANLKRIILASLIVAVGVLSETTVAYVLLFALLWCILSRGSLPRTLLFVGIVAGISLLWSSIVGINFLNWLMFAGPRSSPYGAHGHLWAAMQIIRSILYAFGEYPEVLILFFLGLLRLQNMRLLKIYASLLIPALFLIIVWPVPGTRYSFILFPAVFALAGFGVDEAFAIVAKSPLISTFWPWLQSSNRSLLAFQLLVVAVYVAMTNMLTIGYVSFPWKLLIDPSLPQSWIKWLSGY